MASSSRRFDLGLGICNTTGAKNSHSDRRRHEFFALWGGVEVDFRVCIVLFFFFSENALVFVFHAVHVFDLHLKPI